MNKIKRIDFTQEIAAVIRAAKSENNLRPLLKRYHPRDVAKAASQLTGPERKRLLSLLDAQTLTEIFPYLDNAGRCLVELPEALAANVVAGMDAADALDILRELPAEKTQASTRSPGPMPCRVCVCSRPRKSSVGTAISTAVVASTSLVCSR